MWCAVAVCITSVYLSVNSYEVGNRPFDIENVAAAKSSPAFQFAVIGMAGSIYEIICYSFIAAVFFGIISSVGFARKSKRFSDDVVVDGSA